MRELCGKKTGRSRGKWLGSRQIHCNWATKGVGTSNEKQGSDSKTVVELTNGSSEDAKELANSDAPENNPQYTTDFVDNLAPEVAQLELHHHFYSLGAGVIEDVRLQRDKGFGFVRYNNHVEAALASKMGYTQSVLYDKQIKKVRTYAERQTENKRKLDNNNQAQQQPPNKQSMAIAYTAGSGERKEYDGTIP
ncbi:nucleotide-binding alpha-beta plait domain-containing protein, partial [Tanacetum coccineum]